MRRIKLDVVLFVILAASLTAFAFPQTVTTPGLEIVNTFQQLNTFLAGISIGPIIWSAPIGATSYTLQPPPTSGSPNQALVNTATPGILGWQSTVILNEGTTGSIGGSALSAGQCNSATVSITNAVVGDKVTATPTTYPGDGFYWTAYVSNSGVVTVSVCSVAGGTPIASVYNVGDWP